MIGLRDWPDVDDCVGPVPYFAMDIRVFPEAGGSGLGGEVDALSEMVAHMLVLKDSFGPSVGLGPGMVGLEASESLSARQHTKKMVAEKYSARHFLGIQGAPVESESDNAPWLPETGIPADGLTKVRGDVVPLLKLLESGASNPGSWRPLEGVAWKG